MDIEKAIDIVKASVDKHISSNNYNLKPCPFCGRLDLRLSLKRKWQWPRWVICNYCGTDGPLVNPSDNDDKEAIKAWNKRKNPPLSSC